MKDICIYLIWLRGQVDEDEINAMSPSQMLVERNESRATLPTTLPTTLLTTVPTTVLSARTDQSGLIGLIRHLHGLGFVILSMNREGESANGHGDGHGG